MTAATCMMTSDTESLSIKDLKLFLEKACDDKNMAVLEQYIDTNTLSYDDHVGDLLLLLPRRTGVNDLTARIFEMLSK